MILERRRPDQVSIPFPLYMHYHPFTIRLCDRFQRRETIKAHSRDIIHYISDPLRSAKSIRAKPRIVLMLTNENSIEYDRVQWDSIILFGGGVKSPSFLLDLFFSRVSCYSFVFIQCQSLSHFFFIYGRRIIIGTQL